jgi:tetratricopeptide (TPR) repeat protein
LLSFAAHLDYRLDRYADAEAAATLALATARELKDDETVLQCLRVLGTCCLRRAQYAEAKRYFTEALEASASSADPSNGADMLHNLGTVENSAGNYDEALRLATQSLTRYQQLADHSGEASSLSMLGLMHMNKGEFEAGGARLKQGLAVCERHGLVTLRGITLGGLVDYARKTGDFDAAERYAVQALEFAQTAGYRALAAGLKFDFVHFALERRDLKTARAEIAAALTIATAIGRPTLQVAGVAWFAEILAAQGELDCACQVLKFAIDHPSTHAPAQAEYRARLAQWNCASPTSFPPDVLAFDELVHRIAAEADIDHAPLVATLRGAALNR